MGVNFYMRTLSGEEWRRVQREANARTIHVPCTCGVQDEHGQHDDHCALVKSWTREAERIAARIFEEKGEARA